jgi:hypothetical protein
MELYCSASKIAWECDQDNKYIAYVTDKSVDIVPRQRTSSWASEGCWTVSRSNPPEQLISNKYEELLAANRRRAIS